MAIKIVLTDEDALAWASHTAGLVAPQVLVDLPNAEQNSAGTVVGVVKRGRPRREPVPRDEAGPVIELTKPVATLPDDPLADIGTTEAVADEDPLDLGSDGQSSPAIADDLDLDGPLTALVEYSDAEMAAAAAKFVTTKREPGNRTFRLILGKYATQVANIPQDRRQAFLDELMAAA